MGAQRLPEPVKGCMHCRSANASARSARQELGRTRRLLVKHSFDGLRDRYHAEAITAKALADDSDSRYLIHHAEIHPIPSALPGTDLDSAPSHRKPAMPPATDLAARLRAGETLDALAASYERSAAVVRRRISGAGFNGVTGEQRSKQRAPAGGHAILSFDSQPWADAALCAQTDPEGFYPDAGGSTREAKSVCLSCDVRAECLAYVLTNDERYGVWGGLSERERRKLRKAAS